MAVDLNEIMKPFLIPSGTSDKPRTTANGANDSFTKFENNFISLVVKLFFLLISTDDDVKKK